MIRGAHSRLRAFGPGVVCLLVFCGPGDDLLSRVLRHSTIGAEVFNGRVRDGIGFYAPRSSHRAGERQVCGANLICLFASDAGGRVRALRLFRAMGRDARSRFGPSARWRCTLLSEVKHEVDEGLLCSDVSDEPRAEGPQGRPAAADRSAESQADGRPRRRLRLQNKGPCACHAHGS